MEEIHPTGSLRWILGANKSLHSLSLSLPTFNLLHSLIICIQPPFLSLLYISTTILTPMHVHYNLFLISKYWTYFPLSLPAASGFWDFILFLRNPFISLKGKVVQSIFLCTSWSISSCLIVYIFMIHLFMSEILTGGELDN